MLTARAWTPAVLAAAWIASGGVAAAQAPVRALWSTYLRSGPGQSYPALDEVEHDETVTRFGCAGGWCRVRRGDRDGFVDQTALDLAPPAVVGGHDCVAVHLADDTGRHVTRMCAPSPAPAPVPARSGR